MKKSREDLKKSICEKLDRPIVLIGLMGAGKTRIGRLLAKKLALPFVDSDHEIELAAGCSVSEIFERFGEAAFRDGEKKVIERLIGEGSQVIALGGGAVMTPETAERVWNESISVWIRADLPVLVERTSRTNKRPLLQNGDPEKILEELAEKRYPVYQKADIVLETDDRPASRVVDALLEKLYTYCEGRA